MGRTPPVLICTHFIASTLSCALCIILSTSGIFTATTGHWHAFITVMTTGKLAISVNVTRWSAASAACRCAKACDLQMFATVIFSSFICNGVFPSSSPFTASSISSSLLNEIASEALCGATAGSGTRVVGSALSFPFNFSFHALHDGSFMLARTSSGTASLHIVCLFAFHAQKKLSMTFPYSALISLPPAFSIFSNSSTNCRKYTWKSSALCMFKQ